MDTPPEARWHTLNPHLMTLDENGAKLLVILTRESPAYIDTIDATVHLPKVLADAKPRIYAIHGVGSSSTVRR